MVNAIFLYDYQNIGKHKSVQYSVNPICPKSDVEKDEKFSIVYGMTQGNLAYV